MFYVRFLPLKQFKKCFFSKEKYFFLLLILLILYILTILSDKKTEKPYYLIDKPVYKFIDNSLDNVNIFQQKLKCFPFNSNFTQFKIKIRNQIYPKIIPIYYNNSINFQCLNQSKSIKKILLWNKFIGEPINDIYDGIKKGKIFENCPISNCKVTFDRSQVNSSDFILFHMRSKIDKFPNVRFSTQRWIYVIYESQQHCPMCDKLDDYFNLSSTFRSDSDITSIYLTQSNLKWNKNLKYEQKNYLLENKRGFAAGLISACMDNIKRIDFIHELKKYVPVDIYGKCFNLKCPPKFLDCRKFIGDNYKFFFAFENSLCSEYITEKFFNTLNYHIIPVVLGNGDYAKYVPKSAFINALDFDDVQKLANYLIYLSQNQTAYNEYFKWKRFVITDEFAPKYSIFCEMCIKLQLENYTGIQIKTFKNHSALFKMHQNCKNVKIKQLINGKKFFYFNITENVKMKFFES